MIVVLMVTLVLLALVMVVGSNTIINMRSTSSVTDKREARYAAYAGLQRAMVELQKNYNWKEGFTDVAMPGREGLCYTVKVKNNLNSQLVQTDVPTEEQVPADAVMLEAIAGDRTDPTKPMRAVTGLTGLAVPLGGMFQQAALLDSTVNLDQGGKTEAYDFSVWKDDDRANDVQDTTKGYIDDTINKSQCPERGKVHANRAMKVQNGAKVDGDVKLPYQEDKETGLKKNVHYTGTEEILKTMAKMPGFSPPIDPGMATVSMSNFPATPTDDDGEGDGDGDGDDGTGSTPFVLAEGAYKSIDVPSDQKVVLKTGTYYFKELLSVKGEIIIDASMGPVIVMVGEKMDVAGSGRINENGRPRDLQVYFTDQMLNPDANNPPTDEEKKWNLKPKKKISLLQMAAGSHATMVAAGKNTKASIGTNARLMGALVADHMDLVGGKIQYDIDLKSGKFFDNCPWDLQGVHETAVQR